MTYRVLDLFSGIGCFSLGLERAGGFETVAFCEIDPFCRHVLAKHWPRVPCFEDIRALGREQLADVGAIDVICGGFPCQDLSRAGSGEGLSGERSGLWREYLRLIREIRPSYVLVENVAALLDRGMGVVLGNLAESGFDAEWSIVSGCSMGAPHVRQRLFIVAHAHGLNGWPRLRDSLARQDAPVQAINRLEGARTGWRARLANPSELYRDANGVAFGMDRNHAIGNSILYQIPEMMGRAILAAEAA